MLSTLMCVATRRAKWWEKLGTQPSPAFTVSLASVKADGGLIPCLDLCVDRVFPVIFSEAKVTKFIKPNTDDEAEYTERLRRSRNGEENVLRKFMQRKQDFMTTKQSEIHARIEKEEVRPN